MKTIGLLGGLTFESSLVYYRLINELAREKLGGSHAAKSVIVSVDFGEIEPLMEKGDWDKVQAIMIETARDIERGGANFLVICTNTMHKYAEAIGREIGIPILHIVDATALEIRKTGISKVGLLGTRFTMEEDFFSGRLQEKHGIATLTPDKEDRERLHRIIIDELARGIINPASRDECWKIIGDLAAKGAQGIILGCTEIPLLVTQNQGKIPLFDTMKIHAEAAVDYALKNNS
jgi:aspartate racemase